MIMMTVLVAAAIGYYKENYQGFQVYALTENEEIVSNPYQGAYVQIYTGYWEEIPKIRDKYPDCNLILLAYNLDDEIGLATLPEKKKNDLQKALQTAGEQHFSVIFRGAYDFIGEYEDPEFEIILGHMEQISEILNRYKDCLAGVQAGMIGAFGEWTQSKYMEETHYRMEVLKKWLDILDPEIPVSVRRQKFIREAEEYGLDTTRVGVYNDGLFASESDLGTYREDYNREEDLQWSEENIRVPFNGGEMPFISEYADIANVVKEAGQLQLSYLNQEYNHEVWKLWTSQGYEGMAGDAYLKKHLGIRLWADALKISKNFYKRKNFQMEMDLTNNGFAAPSKEYKAYVLLEYNGEIVKKEAEFTMDTKEKGKISVEMENPFYKEEPEEVRIGVQICRGEAGSERKYDFKLANKEVSYEDGYNWFPVFPEEGAYTNAKK